MDENKPTLCEDCGQPSMGRRFCASCQQQWEKAKLYKQVLSNLPSMLPEKPKP